MLGCVGVWEHVMWQTQLVLKAAFFGCNEHICGQIILEVCVEI